MTSLVTFNGLEITNTLNVVSGSNVLQVTIPGNRVPSSIELF